MVVGNIVRRVLGLIRDEAEDDHEQDFSLSEAGSESQPQTPRAFDGWYPTTLPIWEHIADDSHGYRFLIALR